MSNSALRLAFLLLCVGHLTAWADHTPFGRSFDTVPVKPTAAQDSGIALEGARATPPWQHPGLRCCWI